MIHAAADGRRLRRGIATRRQVVAHGLRPPLTEVEVVRCRTARVAEGYKAMDERSAMKVILRVDG